MVSSGSLGSLIGWEAGMNCTIPSWVLGKMAQTHSQTHKPASSPFCKQSKWDANLPCHPHPTTTQQSSHLRLPCPLWILFLLEVTISDQIFSNFTYRTWIRVETGGWGWGLGTGVGNRRELTGWFTLVLPLHLLPSGDDPDYKLFCALCWMNCNLGAVLILVSLETGDNDSHYS